MHGTESIIKKTNKLQANQMIMKKTSRFQAYIESECTQEFEVDGENTMSFNLEMRIWVIL